MKKVVTRRVAAVAPADDKQVDVVSQVEEFFRQEVAKALQRQKIRVAPDTEFYLVNLLKHFMHSENFFKLEEKGQMRQEVLALLLGQTLADPDTSKRLKGLRRLGDISLYTAGFFADSLSRKVVDIDYYIGMGKNAYSSLASTDLDNYFKKVFGELAERFNKFVDVLAEISEAAGTTDSQNILRLYEKWLKTKSVRAEKQLRELGIIPVKSIKTDIQ